MKALKILGFLTPLAFTCVMQAPPGDQAGVVPLPETVVAHNAKLVGDGDACSVLCLGQPTTSEPDWPQLRVYSAPVSSTDPNGPVLLARVSPGFGTQGLFDFAAAQSAPDTVLLVQHLWSSGVGAKLFLVGSGAHALGDEIHLGIPGYNERRGWSSPVCLDVLHPDLWQDDGRAWLVLSGHNGEVSVSHCDWGQWDRWAESQVVGVGSYPSVCADAERGLFISFTSAKPGSNDYLAQIGAAPRTGTVLLAHSADGTHWSEPMVIVSDSRVASSALAFHPRHGLVLVYSARREEGWPLFVRRSQDGGRTWGAPVMLTEPTAVTMRPDARFCGDRLCVAFIEECEQTRRVCTMVLGPNSLPPTGQE